MNRDKLVFWFIKNCYDLYIDMMKSEHTYNSNSYASIEPNPYHAENTVWTHTMMVMTWCEAKYKSDQDYISLLTTALLHDIGKPYAQELKEPNEKSNKPTRYSFNGHEGVSTFKSIEILKRLQNDFPEIYTDEQIKLILKMISLHGVHISGRNELLQKFRDCDKMGAIRRDTDVQDQYPERKFAKPSEKIPEKNLIILCGLPCSGKSTYFRNELISTHTLLSRDVMMYSFMFPEYDGESYNKIYNDIHNDEELLKQFNEYFDKEVNRIARECDNVVIDMTMLSLKSRRNMLTKFSKFNAKCIVFMTELEEIQKRNNQRQGKFISESVYENMMKSFVYPTRQEGFDSIELILN